MASSLIHICIANEINKILKKDSRRLLIGTIAPDIAKQIGMPKEQSHFQDYDNNMPVLERFLDKYKDNLDDDFVLGYYIHLYADYYWFKYFIPQFVKENYIYKLDGSKLEVSSDEMVNYIYNDYTNLNIQLIDEYMLDLKIFYEELPEFNNIIEEIPMDKLDIIVNKAGVIIEESRKSKSYIFEIREIKKFIEFTVNSMLENLKELGVLK